MYRKTLKISEQQRVLVYRDQVLCDVLTPGKHQFWDFKAQLSFETYDINTLFVTNRSVQRLYQQHSALRQHIECYQLHTGEAGLIYLDGLLQGVVAPGESLYCWRAAGEWEMERVNLEAGLAVAGDQLKAIARAAANSAARLICTEQVRAIAPVAEVEVAHDHTALLYINGELVDQLAPGHYGYWQFNDSVEARHFDTREQLLEVSGQEILSGDRVSLRINLSANIKVLDAPLVAKSIDRVDEFVYKALQLALREAVGTKTLDDILKDKLYVNETVRELVQARLEGLGVALVSVGVKDIILPGEMKTILNQVVEAQKAAEANVIKRREETSATRSLHNTAKMIENNPTLMRLKELEALEKVADKIDQLTVYGGLQGLMQHAVKLVD